MNKTTLLTTLTTLLIEIIPDLEETSIDPDALLVDIGMNSIDRGELITLSLETLDLDISRIEFVGAQTLGELADLLIEKM